MAIQTVVDAIQTGVAVVDSTIRFEEDRGQTVDVNSILWFPKGGPHSAAVGLGGAHRDGPLLTRNLTLLFRCWGVDYDATEAIVNLLLNVVHGQLSQRGCQPGGEEWQIGSAMNKGRECGIAVVLRIPVQRTPGVTIQVTTVTPTYHLNPPEATG